MTVFAAASLTDALKELASGWEKSGGDKVVFNLAASSTLARQIREGAPADLFLSADEIQMDTLEKAGLIAPGTRKSIISNTLVVVVPSDSPLRISNARDLAGPGVTRLALAEPASVPAGIYAKKLLEGVGIWKDVSARIVPTENVRAALAAVESGNVDAGIVYRTDALSSKKIRVAYEVPAKDGPPISYPFALLREAPSPAAAKKFLDFLSSQAARGVFARHGFVVKE